jgi:hypothetical protein
MNNYFEIADSILTLKSKFCKRIITAIAEKSQLHMKNNQLF